MSKTEWVNCSFTITFRGLSAINTCIVSRSSCHKSAKSSWPKSLGLHNSIKNWGIRIGAQNPLKILQHKPTYRNSKWYQFMSHLIQLIGENIPGVRKRGERDWILRTWTVSFVWPIVTVLCSITHPVTRYTPVPLCHTVEIRLTTVLWVEAKNVMKRCSNISKRKHF